MRPTIPAVLDMVIEEVRAIFAPPLIFLIRSVVLLLGVISNLWEMHALWENAYNLVVCLPKAPKLKT